MKNRVLSYQSNLSAVEEKRQVLLKKSRNYAFLRLGIILLGLVPLFYISQVSVLAAGLTFILIFIAFTVVLRIHDKTDRERYQTEQLIKINENEINALMRLKNGYEHGQSFLEHGHFYTNDLDVFGDFSLFGLINRCRTYHGNRMLGSWFSQLDSLAEIEERTKSVKELESEHVWRQGLAAHLYDLEGEEAINYAEAIRLELDANLDFVSSPWLRIYRNILPALWLLILGLAYFLPSYAAHWVIGFMLLNLAITMKFVKPISHIQNRLSKSGVLLERFMKSLYHIVEKKWSASFNRSKVDQFEANLGSENHPIKVLASLKKIIDQLDYRLNIIAAFFLNGVMLWDLKMIDKLARWKNEHLDKIEDIFGMIGHFEAISSLSTWAYNHPDFVYAKIDDNHFHLSAKSIGHPLIPEGQNIANDLEINPEGRIQIVTGSNMAGKSTFLRTIGSNMLLAYAGTRVAAEALKISRAQLMTYMRIKDALEENVSTFKAELNRVELMLSLVKERSKCLILIDEMLRGTNSKDKLKGSINITKKLIEEGAYAMIATHDIKLAEMVEEYPGIINNYFFDIDFEDGDLKFDYKLKAGICQNFNASYLLEQIGIGSSDNKEF